MHHISLVFGLHRLSCAAAKPLRRAWRSSSAPPLGVALFGLCLVAACSRGVEPLHRNAGFTDAAGHADARSSLGPVDASGPVASPSTDAGDPLDVDAATVPPVATCESVDITECGAADGCCPEICAGGFDPDCVGYVCTADSECGAGHQCHLWARGVCLISVGNNMHRYDGRSCVKDSDCVTMSAVSWSCTGLSGACTHSCGSSADCPTDSACDAATLLCRPRCRRELVPNVCADNSLVCRRRIEAGGGEFLGCVLWP
jgi:hypothetical protein